MKGANPPDIWKVSITEVHPLDQFFGYGPFGLTGIPRTSIFGYKFDSIRIIALFSSIITGIRILGMVLILRSPWGRLLKAMKDDKLAARSLGKNTRLARASGIHDSLDTCCCNNECSFIIKGVEQADPSGDTEIMIADSLQEKCKIKDYMDTLHIASAATANCEYFVTCDDEITRSADLIKKELIKLGYRLEIVNPLDLMKED